jgi:hypothetical protein
MSKPRPIHKLHRELNVQADEAEPSFSYEQESFLMGKEEDVEDEFHRRIDSTRRDSGGSFWRTTGSSGDLAAPSFSSMSMKQRQDATTSFVERRPNERVAVASFGKSLPEQIEGNASSGVANVSRVASCGPCHHV